MKIAMVLLPLLVMACAFTGSIEEAIMGQYEECPEGREIELSSTEQKGMMKIKETKEFVFGGWENETCTMRYLFGSCNYTKDEVRTSNYSEFSELLLGRCFGSR